MMPRICRASIRYSKSVHLRIEFLVVPEDALLPIFTAPFAIRGQSRNAR